MILHLCNIIGDIRNKHEILCENQLEKDQMEDQRSTTHREVGCGRNVMSGIGLEMKVWVCNSCCCCWC